MHIIVEIKKKKLLEKFKEIGDMKFIMYISVSEHETVQLES